MCVGGGALRRRRAGAGASRPGAGETGRGVPVRLPRPRGGLKWFLPLPPGGSPHALHKAARPRDRPQRSPTARGLAAGSAAVAEPSRYPAGAGRGQGGGLLLTAVERARCGRLRGRSAILRRAALRAPSRRRGSSPLDGLLGGPGACPLAALSSPLSLAGSTPPPRLSRRAVARRRAARAAGGALPWLRLRRGRARPHACRGARSTCVARGGDAEGGVVQRGRPSAKRGAPRARGPAVMFPSACCAVAALPAAARRLARRGAV